MKLFPLVCIGSTQIVAAASANPSCTALALGGFGSQQAYLAGALDSLANAGVEYDVVVSTGASILASVAASTSTSKEFAKNALNLMTSVSAKQMYKKDPAGSVDALTNKGGLYNASVSSSYYENILSSGTQSDRQVFAVAMSLSTTLQTPITVRTSDVTSSVQGLVASASDPSEFTAYQASFEGQTDFFVSGAVRGPVDVFEAVTQCRRLGTADSDITVDVVYTSSSSLSERDVSKDKTLAVTARDDNIKKYYAATQDVLFAKLAHPDVNFRYDVSPADAMTTDEQNYALINKLAMINRGKDDAKTEINRIQSGAECKTTTAAIVPCVTDQDCISWAVKNCISPSMPKKGRCLLPKVTNLGTCSFNATEIAGHYDSRVTKTDSDGTCLAIAFSGGGDRGAYEAGVVKGLVTSQKAEDVAWQSASGVSVGSIVSSALSRYPIGEEDSAADFMVDTALGVNGDIIYNAWGNLVPFIGPSGMTRGLLFESGLYDSSAERSFLEKEFFPQPLDPLETYRRHTVFSTNMGTGKLNN